MCGQARHMTFRFTLSDPINFIVLGAIVDITTEGAIMHYPRIVPDGQQ